MGMKSSRKLDCGQASSTKGFLALCSNPGMTDPLVNALTRLCGGTERSAKARRQEVAEILGVNEQTLYQIIKGIKLESGRSRTVGRKLREKLDKHFPDWLTAEDIAAAEAGRNEADPNEELRRALLVIRKRLEQARGDQSIAIGEALRQLALTPDSDRAFDSAADLVSWKPGQPDSLVIVQAKATLKPEPELTATEDERKAFRIELMRMAEDRRNPEKQKKAAETLALWDEFVRAHAITSNPPETRHGNNSPA